MDTARPCTKCKRLLPLESFGRSKNGPGGLNYWCKSCVCQNAKAHKDRVRATLGENAYREQRREYYKASHQRIQTKRAMRQELRREHFTEEALKWQRLNSPKVKQAKRKYRAANVEKVREYSRDYHRTHKRERNAHLKRRKASDPIFKLRERLRSTFADKLRMTIQAADKETRNIKVAGVLKLIGCSLSDLIIHLERQFQSGMTWNKWGRGRGKWHIDHIRPISSFDLTSADEQLLCWHYTNLRPLWAEENLSKGPKWQRIDPRLSSLRKSKN